MAYSEGYDLGLIRLNGHIVVGDNGQLVSINAELLDTLGTSIDQSQPMLLPGRELKLGKTCVVRAWRSISDKRAIVVHLPVDQIINRFRRYLSEICTHNLFYDVIVRLMIIVRQ